MTVRERYGSRLSREPPPRIDPTVEALGHYVNAWPDGRRRDYARAVANATLNPNNRWPCWRDFGITMQQATAIVTGVERIVNPSED